MVKRKLKEYKLTDDEANELKRIIEQINQIDGQIRVLQLRRIYFEGQKDYILSKLSKKYNFNPKCKFRLDTDHKKLVKVSD